MHRPRTLRWQLLRWFSFAILLAILASVLAFYTTRPDSVTGAEAMARNVGSRLASSWDDPEATRAFVGEVRDVTGFDVQLVREPGGFPRACTPPRATASPSCPTTRSTSSCPWCAATSCSGRSRCRSSGRAPPRGRCSRFVLALALAGLLLSVMAGSVANRLARPLERLAQAADRFGGGDLDLPRRRRGARGAGWRVEVRDVGVAFNRMADRVEAMVRGQRELLGAISHELRSPLGRARVALEIARDRTARLARRGRGRRRAPRGRGPRRRREAARRGGRHPGRSARRDARRPGRSAQGDAPLRALAARAPGRGAGAPRRPRSRPTPRSRTWRLPFDAPLLARAVHNLVQQRPRARAPRRPSHRGERHAARRAARCRVVRARSRPRLRPGAGRPGLRALRPRRRGAQPPRDPCRRSRLGPRPDHRAPRGRGARGPRLRAQRFRRRRAAAAAAVGVRFARRDPPAR